MSRSALKYRVIQPIEKFFVTLRSGLRGDSDSGHPGDALLETIGRRTGRMRRTPMCDGLEGDTFWLVVQHGRRTDYVRNIRPILMSGAQPDLVPPGELESRTSLDDDDPNERVRILGQSDPWRQLCLGASKAMGTDLLTVRIDLDPL